VGKAEIKGEAMTERPIIFSGPMVRSILDGRKTQTRRVVKYKANAEEGSTVHPHECPFGPVGTRLWVRETWRLPAGAPIGWVDYKADDDRVGFKWRPSIFMPRWASRITLEVMGVKVERLQDISEADTMAEGVDLSNELYPNINASYKARIKFMTLWNSINGKKPGRAWVDNPFVWAITFRRLKPRVKEVKQL
jgi:hypothetical protein